MQKKVLAFSGSLRSQSYNLKLVRALGKLLDADPNFHCQVLDPSALQLPLFNEDTEATDAKKVESFRKALAEAQVIAIASPEYNGSYSSALKNAIDWATRQPENLWAGKVIVLMAASPGGLGGVRGLIQLKTLLSGIKAWVLPEQVLCPNAHTAFTPSGELQEEAVKKQMQGAIVSLNAFCDRYLQNSK